MFVEGTIKLPNCLVRLENAVGFVQVKYNENFIEKHTKISFSIKANHYGVLFINGFKMKEKYCGVDECSLFSRSTVIGTCTTASTCASTEVRYESVYEATSLGEQFEAILNFIRRMRVQANVE
ncbi:unnamed protein product [Rotaria sp. Silwood1]|nr:unnamed protein product [Rotaria sp. Silwood1]CAF1652460.1 unnamed protein product [Rotaria sp. Silwood1]CAF3756214.1 unnamed protein product [Rotaria sp. Silwood1]CAF3841332.1 unnamed protein product [Rotaria sp. Silwood1]CAF4715436.1 unnamed protein product [Rotaria sp. Silwood1]